jgi:antitoxin ParD1/3/4
MNVSLTPELERKIEERLATGDYTSASEVVREALRLLFRFDEAREREIDLLNRRIADGLAQLDRGEGLGEEEARRALAARTAARRASKASPSA